MHPEGRKKGAIIKLFGVVLIFIGALDAMLSWRGGMGLSSFYVFLIAGGIFLVFIGAVRQGAAASLKPGDGRP